MLLSAYLPFLLLQLPHSDRPDIWWLEYLPPHSHRDKASIHININSCPTIIKLWKFKLSKLCFSLSFKNISFCFLWNFKWLFNYKRYTISKYIITSLANFFISFILQILCVFITVSDFAFMCLCVCFSEPECFLCLFFGFFSVSFALFSFI